MKLLYLLVHCCWTLVAGNVHNTNRGVVAIEKVLCRNNALSIVLPILDIRLQCLVLRNILEVTLLEKQLPRSAEGVLAKVDLMVSVDKDDDSAWEGWLVV